MERPGRTEATAGRATCATNQIVSSPDRDGRGHVGQRNASALDPPPRERREREHGPAGEHAAEARPRLGGALGALDDRRADLEDDPRHRDGREPAAEQQVVAAALDHEPRSP